MEIMYRYDGLGRRVRKEVNDLVTPANSIAKRFYYLEGNLHAESNVGSNTLTALYLHEPGRLDQPVLTLQDINKDGVFDSQTELLFYTRDALGSVRELVKKDGSVAQRYDYTAYGETSVTQPGGGQAIPNPYAFTGREYEAETGLYYYRARYYDPEIGQFLSADPIGFGGGDVNLYRYVWNNPQRYTGPKGLCVPTPFGGCFPGPSFLGIQNLQQAQAFTEATARVGVVAGAAACGALAAPAIVSAGVSAATTVTSACLSNPVLCQEVGIAAVGGVLGGLGQGMLPPNSSSTFSGGVFGPVIQFVTEQLFH